MPYTKLKTLILKMYGPALHLRVLLPVKKREVLYPALVYASVSILVFVALLFYARTTPLVETETFSFLSTFALRSYGLFLIIFSCAFIFGSLEALHRSYYFTGLGQVLSETTDNDHETTTWEVATVVNETSDEDITGGFINSVRGQEVLYRAGINSEAFTHYDLTRSTKLHGDMFMVENDKSVVLSTYVGSIYKNDLEFREFLAKNNINERQLLRAAEWVSEIEQTERKAKRWWSRDNLGRIPGLGKTWAYGETYLLKKYGHELTEDHIWSSALMTRREERDEVEELEQVLSRARQANVLLLSNDVLNARRRTAQLYHRIREGVALPVLESKRIFLVDIESIVIATGEKQSFENELLKVLEQARSSGNTILYLEHLATSVESSRTFGTDLVECILPYLESDYIQIIIGELSESYNKYLARDSRINQFFDVVEMKDVDDSGVFDLIKQRASAQEKRTNIVFTVPALEKIGTLAERYFPTGEMPDKAFDLLEELIPMALSHGIMQLTQKDVEHLVTQKTHIPTGEPDAEERDKLLHLEEKLHQRVIAQERAIQAISQALRRARSGISNPKKPMGTFLFLGPTGVGKTETAKALAEVLFDDEEAMIRLDMSEFQSPYALDELVGSTGSEELGRLESMVRKQQYGVLLLDEFEKSHKTVQDLFLQVLDEGYFTNSAGHTVNMRNLIIIATSNAGADRIWEWEKSGKQVEETERELVDHIIKEGIYRPELLNRFDEIVIFHVLSAVQVHRIAELHLKSFAKRVLKEQNITVKITDTLVRFVAEKGYDPQFGGRPLERAIQTIVQQKIADEVLKGALRPGDTYEFK